MQFFLVIHCLKGSEKSKPQMPKPRIASAACIWIWEVEKNCLFIYVVGLIIISYFNFRQIIGVHTVIRNKNTPRDEFIFYSKRLIRLVSFIIRLVAAIGFSSMFLILRFSAFLLLPSYNLILRKICRCRWDGLTILWQQIFLKRYAYFFTLSL